MLKRSVDFDPSGLTLIDSPTLFLLRAEYDAANVLSVMPVFGEADFR